MTQMVGERIEELRATMAGSVIAPGDAGYDNARRVWNAGIDRRPAAIARCDSTADVVAALAFGREHDLEVSVRGGAHNTAGTAICDDVLMIDLSKLNDVAVDPDARRAEVGGGAQLADLDAASMEYGMAVPAGMISHTGVGGLTLGGGMGWLTRQFGLSIDNLLSAEIVTASGEVVRAAADERPELFWAIRGGGGANAWGSHCYEKGTYIEDLSDAVIDVLTRHVPEKTSPMSLLLPSAAGGRRGSAPSSWA